MDSSLPLQTDAAASPQVTRFHLSIAYDGTRYAGWQVQPDHPTVQGELLTRLRLMLRAPELKIYGSSRTDAGVHALDQQVSFEAVLPGDVEPSDLARRLNRWLPEDIYVRSARVCPGPFHARHDNCGKAYTYCLAPGFKPNPLYVRYLWRTPRALDLSAMAEAAALLQGEHDFASFAVNSGKPMESTVRNLRRLWEAGAGSGDPLREGSFPGGGFRPGPGSLPGQGLLLPGGVAELSADSPPLRLHAPPLVRLPGEGRPISGQRIPPGGGSGESGDSPGTTPPDPWDYRPCPDRR